jgi:hypothetical protein
MRVRPGIWHEEMAKIVLISGMKLPIMLLEVTRMGDLTTTKKDKNLSASSMIE